MNQRKKSQQEISSWVSVIRDAEKTYGLVINAEVFQSLLPEWQVLSKFSFDAVYIYADDTTIYCIDDSVDEVIFKLNKALQKLHCSTWCELTSLVPHPKTCEGMIINRKK